MNSPLQSTQGTGWCVVCCHSGSCAALGSESGRGYAKMTICSLSKPLEKANKHTNLHTNLLHFKSGQFFFLFSAIKQHWQPLKNSSIMTIYHHYHLQEIMNRYFLTIAQEAREYERCFPIFQTFWG